MPDCLADGRLSQGTTASPGEALVEREAGNRVTQRLVAGKRLTAEFCPSCSRFHAGPIRKGDLIPVRLPISFVCQRKSRTCTKAHPARSWSVGLVLLGSYHAQRCFTQPE